jgi:hypothetical protein
MPIIDLSLTRRKWIADLAQTAFSEAGGISPIDLIPFIEKLGITLSTDDYGEAFDGLLEHRSGRFHIYCNVHDRWYLGTPRVRFTLAHELGHYFIDEHRNALASGQVPSHPSFIDKGGESVIEAEANTFASYLLMPQHDFKFHANEKPTGLQHLLDLSSTFHTSAQATAIRYVDDCVLPCAAVMFRPGKRPWFAISPSLRRLGFDFISLMEISALPAGFASRQAHELTAPFGLSDIVETISTASYWFRNVAACSPKNHVIKEQAVKLGAHGVLCLLIFNNT